MFAAQNHRLPCLQSFEDCEQWFKKTDHPGTLSRWREHQNSRPLDRPTMLHKRLIKRDEDAYVCRFYNCDHVVYHRDGSVNVTLHDSMSSKSFLGRMLPQGVTTNNDAGIMMLSVETAEGQQWFTSSNGTPFTLKPIPKTGNLWEVVSGYGQRQRKFVDDQKGAEVRRMLKPFMSWYRSMEKLVGWEYQQTAKEWALKNVDAADPSNWNHLAIYMSDRAKFMQIMYELHGARYIQDIPNTTPPMRNGVRALT